MKCNCSITQGALMAQMSTRFGGGRGMRMREVRTVNVSLEIAYLNRDVWIQARNDDNQMQELSLKDHEADQIVRGWLRALDQTAKNEIVSYLLSDVSDDEFLRTVTSLTRGRLREARRRRPKGKVK